MPSPGDLVEVFHTRSDIEVRKILDLLLPNADIEAVAHERTDNAFPARDTQPGGSFIAVPSDQAARARRILADALTDGFVVDGEVIAG